VSSITTTITHEPRAERLSRQEKKEKERPAGKLHLSILYNPPLGNWDGYLTVNGTACP
jgi:hypothetical protein